MSLKLLRPREIAVALIAALAISGAALLPPAIRPDALGLTASVISFVLFIPQATTVWSARSDPHALSGVSLQTQALILANATIWGLYAFTTQAFWVGAPGLVNGPLALIVITLVLRSRRARQNPPPGCPWCGFQDGEHRVFVTNPAGYGSTVACTAASARNGIAVPAPPAVPAP